MVLFLVSILFLAFLFSFFCHNFSNEKSIVLKHQNNMKSKGKQGYYFTTNGFKNEKWYNPQLSISMTVTTGQQMKRCRHDNILINLFKTADKDEPSNYVSLYILQGAGILWMNNEIIMWMICDYRKIEIKNLSTDFLLNKSHF